jgi:hypothetical protein
MARLAWRKQNLAIIHAAEWARRRCNEIIEEEKAQRPLLSILEAQLEESELMAAREEAVQAGQEKARDELGEYYELARDGYHIEALAKDLEVLALLDAMIDKCVKRFLMVRGAKSMSVVSRLQPANSPSRKESGGT